MKWKGRFLYREKKCSKLAFIQIHRKYEDKRFSLRWFQIFEKRSWPDLWIHRIFVEKSMGRYLGNKKTKCCESPTLSIRWWKRGCGSEFPVAAATIKQKWKWIKSTCFCEYIDDMKCRHRTGCYWVLYSTVEQLFLHSPFLWRTFTVVIFTCLHTCRHWVMATTMTMAVVAAFFG